MIKKIIVTGCLLGASFFISCKEEPQAEEVKTEPKKYEMYEDSELALLMRKMYADNLEIRKEIMEGKIPESFPEDFYTIHTARATEPEKLTATFKSLAEEYLKRMEVLAAAQDEQAAKVAYNDMVMSCASCHQIYCQGPLPKIRKMRIPLEE
jgi:cytochrome c556